MTVTVSFLFFLFSQLHNNQEAVCEIYMLPVTTVYGFILTTAFKGHMFANLFPEHTISSAESISSGN